MKRTPIQFDDLPDEILLIIFKKLSNTTLLYSLTGVNQRLNQILHDSTLTNRLTLVRFIQSHLIDRNSLSSLFAYPLTDPVLDRFCLHILPEIHRQIQWLCLEPLSLKRVLRATNYPNLCGLSIMNIGTEETIDLFSGKISPSIVPGEVIHYRKDVIN